ncbi:MAG: hypothetical protein ACXWXA_05350 [Candidatus Limnocylindrales bacterium]
MLRWYALSFALAVALAACDGTVPSPTSTTVPETTAAAGSPFVAAPSAATSSSGAACRPTDQDAFVYHPARLQVVNRCVLVYGTVAVIRHEADGDLHMLLALAPKFRNLLRPANQGVELGDLVVEPVCVNTVTQADATATCSADKHPLKVLPTVGDQVWMQGRYVLDLDHGGWAELHPLYRWGIGTGPTAPSPIETPPAATAKPAHGSVALTVRISSVTSPAYRNATATLGARTHAGARCSIEVDYASGPSSAAGLAAKTATSSGSVSWTWKIGGRTTKGT